MARLLKKRHRKKGLPPGSLISIDEIASGIEASIQLVTYNTELFEQKKVTSIQECVESAHDPNSVTWINISGVASPKTMEDVGHHFGLHRLWLEDVLNTDHRPKIDELQDLVFAVIKCASFKSETALPGSQITFEQISLFLGPNFVISFEENPGDSFASVHKRIQTNKGKIREAGADHLFYALIDSVVDDYFIVLENLGGIIDKLTQELETSRQRQITQKLVHLKTDTLQLRRAVLPIRDSLLVLAKTPHQGIKPNTLSYFQDAYEHTLQIVEVIDDYKEVLSDLSQAHRSLTNERLNEIMKILTVFTAIFTPLTFIVGVYGMNFRNIPELNWEYGYLMSWFIMLTIGVGMTLFFRRKKWI